MWNKTAEQFIEKPMNACSFIEYLNSLNVNTANYLKDDIFGHVYWIKRFAKWRKPHQDTRYIHRAEKVLNVIVQLQEKGYFKPELNVIGNEVTRTRSMSFDDFWDEFIGAKKHKWVYGDSISGCISVEEDLKTYAYSEGDVSIVTCSDLDHFQQEVGSKKKWVREYDYL